MWPQEIGRYSPWEHINNELPNKKIIKQNMWGVPQTVVKIAKKFP
jgi:hypothetical protein